MTFWNIEIVMRKIDNLKLNALTQVIGRDLVLERLLYYCIDLG